MKKVIICIFLLFSCVLVFSQTPDRRVLFVIDSIPQLRDPEEWNKIMTDDIADISVIKNKDSLKMLGWGQMEAITFIFTKAYRKRPDSIKKIPSLKQMELKEGYWQCKGKLYSGKYIDYYNNGSLMDEGELMNGKLNGRLIIYFKNGNKRSDTEYDNGLEHGWKYDYYQNGTLMQSVKYSYGRYIYHGKMYFFNRKSG